MKNTKLSEQKLAFVDLETTGLSFDNHEIIEIGLLVYNPSTGEVEREWETKIAPTHIETAEDAALRINGYINNPEAYNGNLKSALIKFNSLVKGCIIVGQNIGFDLSFINKNMRELGIKPRFSHRNLDLIGLAWFVVKDTDIPGISLERLCNHFGVSNVGAHTALVDCRRTFEIYRKLLNIYKS
jgi:DNA polymerase III alpha subunit (gram-positive type)